MNATMTTQSPAGTPAIIRLNADPLGWKRLPQLVKDKLRRLRRARDDARLVSRAIADERAEARDAKQQVEARLKQLTGYRADSPYYGGVQHAKFQRLATDEPEVMVEIENLSDLTANIERLNPIVDASSQQSQQLGRQVRFIEDYLTEGLSRFGGTITIHKGPSPVQQKREAPIDAVERCRRRLRELEADAHRIKSAPWHSTEAKLRARAEIDALAERGQPSALALIETGDGSICWAERHFTDVVIAGRLVSAPGDPPVLPLMFWLNRDAIVLKIEQQIDEIADDAASLTQQQRTEQIAEIDRDSLATQRDEEFWVCKALGDGMTMLRRPDADPRAVLGLGDDMPAPMIA